MKPIGPYQLVAEPGTIQASTDFLAAPENMTDNDTHSGESAVYDAESIICRRKTHEFMSDDVLFSPLCFGLGLHSSTTGLNNPRSLPQVGTEQVVAVWGSEDDHSHAVCLKPLNVVMTFSCTSPSSTGSTQRKGNPAMLLPAQKLLIFLSFFEQLFATLFSRGPQAWGVGFRCGCPDPVGRAPTDIDLRTAQPQAMLF